MKPELPYFINQCIIGTKCLFRISCCRDWNLLCVYWDHTLSGSYSTGTAECGFCCESQCLDTEALTRECPKLILQVPAAWGEQPSFSAESWIQTLCGSDPEERGKHALIPWLHSLYFVLIWKDDAKCFKIVWERKRGEISYIVLRENVATLKKYFEGFVT